MAFKERLFKALHEKNSVQRHLVRKYFFWPLEKVGLHLTADHFYEIIPNTGQAEHSYYEYPKDWIVKERRFWNEQYLLECFLMFNSAFEVYLPVHLLARQSEPVLNAVRELPLDPNFKLAGGSFYLRRAG